jgi:hypothetical protein
LHRQNCVDAVTLTKPHQKAASTTGWIAVNILASLIDLAPQVAPLVGRHAPTTARIAPVRVKNLRHLPRLSLTLILIGAVLTLILTRILALLITIAVLPAISAALIRATLRISQRGATTQQDAANSGRMYTSTCHRVKFF